MRLFLSLTLVISLMPIESLAQRGYYRPRVPDRSHRTDFNKLRNESPKEIGGLKAKLTKAKISDQKKFNTLHQNFTGLQIIKSGPMRGYAKINAKSFRYGMSTHAKTLLLKAAKESGSPDLQKAIDGIKSTYWKTPEKGPTIYIRFSFGAQKRDVGGIGRGSAVRTVGYQLMGVDSYEISNPAPKPKPKVQAPVVRTQPNSGDKAPRASHKGGSGPGLSLGKRAADPKKGWDGSAKGLGKGLTADAMPKLQTAFKNNPKGIMIERQFDRNKAQTIPIESEIKPSAQYTSGMTLLTAKPGHNLKFKDYRFTSNKVLTFPTGTKAVATKETKLIGHDRKKGVDIYKPTLVIKDFKMTGAQILKFQAMPENKGKLLETVSIAGVIHPGKTYHVEFRTSSTEDSKGKKTWGARMYISGWTFSRKGKAFEKKYGADPVAKVGTGIKPGEIAAVTPTARTAFSEFKATRPRNLEALSAITLSKSPTATKAGKTHMVMLGNIKPGGMKMAIGYQVPIDPKKPKGPTKYQETKITIPSSAKVVLQGNNVTGGRPMNFGIAAFKMTGAQLTAFAGKNKIQTYKVNVIRGKTTYTPVALPPGVKIGKKGTDYAVTVSAQFNPKTRKLDWTVHAWQFNTDPSLNGLK